MTTEFDLEYFINIGINDSILGFKTLMIYLWIGYV